MEAIRSFLGLISLALLKPKYRKTLDGAEMKLKQVVTDSTRIVSLALCLGWLIATFCVTKNRFDTPLTAFLQFLWRGAAGWLAISVACSILMVKWQTSGRKWMEARIRRCSKVEIFYDVHGCNDQRSSYPLNPLGQDEDTHVYNSWGTHGEGGVAASLKLAPRVIILPPYLFFMSGEEEIFFELGDRDTIFVIGSNVTSPILHVICKDVREEGSVYIGGSEVGVELNKWTETFYVIVVPRQETIVEQVIEGTGPSGKLIPVTLEYYCDQIPPELEDVLDRLQADEVSS